MFREFISRLFRAFAKENANRTGYDALFLEFERSSKELVDSEIARFRAGECRSEKST
jgi:hypothetical protein